MFTCGSNIQRVILHTNPFPLDTIQLFTMLDGTPAQILGHPLIKVGTTQSIISNRGQHFRDSTAYLQDGHIEGSPAEIEYEDQFFLIVVFDVLASVLGSIGKRRRFRLCQQFHLGHACQFRRADGRLSLRLCKISGNSNDGSCHLDYFVVGVPMILLGSVV
mmetsp:Transcript_33350/g.60097  ORF Transcript_33350/g.60097 Transcript_33350/m.60097 type:complete len:161 (-) Transcript_33350:1079-1561(-)